MPNFLPPAGTPIYTNDIYCWFKNMLNNKQNIEILRSIMCEQFSTKHCYFASTGRAAFTVILHALNDYKNDKRNEIIIPSYTCFSVPASILKAGFKIRICDIDPRTLNYDLDKLSQFDFSNVLAITTSSLYGIPNNLDKVEKIAKNNHIYLIDDAAQSMGATVNSQYCGTFGAVGLFSLDKGKNVTSIQGGIIVTNNDKLADYLSKLENKLHSPSMVSVSSSLLKVFIYALMLKPSVYWITKYTPFLNLGKTPFTLDFPLEKYPDTLAALVIQLITKLNKYQETRISNALNLIRHIPSEIGFPIVANERTNAVYVRLPVILNRPEIRETFIARFIEKGISATASYPSTIDKIPELRDLLNSDDMYNPGGEAVSNGIITLPTHPYTRKKHLDIMVNILNEFRT